MKNRAYKLHSIILYNYQMIVSILY